MSRRRNERSDDDWQNMANVDLPQARKSNEEV